MLVSAIKHLLIFCGCFLWFFNSQGACQEIFIVIILQLHAPHAKFFIDTNFIGNVFFTNAVEKLVNPLESLSL